VTRTDADLADDDLPAAKPGHVWVTRRTWDRYFLPAVAVAAVIGAVEWWRLGEPRRLTAPLMFVLMWVFIRWSWPREGSLTERLTATPGMIPLLKWLAAWGLAGCTGLVALDALGVMPPEGRPWSLRSGLVVAGSMIAWLAVLCVVGSRIERRYMKPKSADGRRLE
jgi:hypothetical protein